MNKYLEKIALDMDAVKEPNGSYSVPPHSPSTQLSIPLKTTYSKVEQPGILGRIAGRIGKMGTLGKLGLGAAAGIAGTKLLSSNNSNNQN